jgi:hypothetical protein
MRRRAALLLAVGGLAALPLHSACEESLTPAAKAILVAKVGELLTSTYVFPEVASRMVARLAALTAEGEFGAASDGVALSALLTNELRAVSHDQHLLVRHLDAGPPQVEAEPTPPDAVEDPERERAARCAREAVDNFGIRRIEVLDGNVGLLDLRNFAHVDCGGDAVAAAMTVLAHTSALIIDLRANGGGNPEMVTLWTSYLFPPEPVQLSGILSREDGLRERWTAAYVHGPRYVGRPVYLLTSRQTFSAGEGFAYDLENAGRATVVGEVTAGAAHPGREYPLGDCFAMFIPNGAVVSPVTGTDWEGTGVVPKIAVPASDALATAYRAVLARVPKAP